MPAPCESGYSIDWSASLEPSLPFASLLTPVLTADGPDSSHPPAAPNGVDLPLVRMVPFFSTDLSSSSSWPSPGLTLETQHWKAGLLPGPPLPLVPTAPCPTAQAPPSPSFPHQGWVGNIPFFRGLQQVPGF